MLHFGYFTSASPTVSQLISNMFSVDCKFIPFSNGVRQSCHTFQRFVIDIKLHFSFVKRPQKVKLITTFSTTRVLTLWFRIMMKCYCSFVTQVSICCYINIDLLTSDPYNSYGPYGHYTFQVIKLQKTEKNGLKDTF